MDEIFGFFPPVAEPPSKRPLLTLLKQARAFGVGILLATQNPVDLDYKGLANAGTWFIGRLQTERDKDRLLEGLEGVAAGTEAGFDRQKMEETLAGLGKRIFLMYNVHEDAPVTFQTRWVMSYLSGPLTRAQIKVLMDPRRPLVTVQPAAAAPPTGIAPAGAAPASMAAAAPRHGAARSAGRSAAGRSPRRHTPVLSASAGVHPTERYPGLPAWGPGGGNSELREHRDGSEPLHQDPPHRAGARERFGRGLGGGHSAGAAARRPGSGAVRRRHASRRSRRR